MAKKFKSVLDMVQGLSEDPGTTKAFQQKVQSRVVISRLIALRIQQKIGQDAIAQAMNCTQSRVSKLENGPDSALTLQDLDAYMRVLKLEVTLFIRSEGDSLMDVVKSHAFQMMACLQQIKELSKDDKVMEHGAALAYVETLMNMTTMILQQGASLPQFQSAMNGLMKSHPKGSKLAPRQRLRIMEDSALAPT